VLTEYELHLFNEGTLHRAYEKLGAHRRDVDGASGVHFAVWAPNASQVSVIGDFNGWNGTKHPMRNLGASGIWETFVPNVGDGDRYKFEITARGSAARLQKTDPYGTFFESDASGAAIVWDLARHTWRDTASRILAATLTPPWLSSSCLRSLKPIQSSSRPPTNCRPES